MKSYPFMIGVPLFHFNKIEIGQVLQIENKSCLVTKIISIKKYVDMLEVIGMCKEEV